MATPNQMPRKTNPLHLQILGGLIETKAVSWDRKSLSKGKDGKEVVESTKVQHQALRSPLAQNVSALNVERAAAGWTK